MNVAYYPGCSVHGLAREYRESIELVCRRLRISLEEVKDWNCCGATAARSCDRVLSVALGARNLARAREMGFDRVVTPCPGCFSHLKVAAYELSHFEDVRLEVERRSGFTLKAGGATVQVSHLLQFLVEEVGLEHIASQTRRSLTGTRLAAYYGCLLTRPSKFVHFDDPEQPSSLDQLLRCLGANTVVWSHKAECCGAGVAVWDPKVALDLGTQVLASAKEAGAEAIVVACPLCQTNLDIRQAAMEAHCETTFRLPIIYFTQLMGLAFDLSPRVLGFRRHLVDPRPQLISWGLG